MTCDHDHFNQGMKFQHSWESSHGQWSRTKSPEIPCNMEYLYYNSEHLLIELDDNPQISETEIVKD